MLHPKRPAQRQRPRVGVPPLLQRVRVPQRLQEPPPVAHAGRRGAVARQQRRGVEEPPREVVVAGPGVLERGVGQVRRAVGVGGGADGLAGLPLDAPGVERAGGGFLGDVPDGQDGVEEVVHGGGVEAERLEAEQRHGQGRDVPPDDLLDGALVAGAVRRAEVGQVAREREGEPVEGARPRRGLGGVPGAQLGPDRPAGVQLVHVLLEDLPQRGVDVLDVADLRAGGGVADLETALDQVRDAEGLEPVPPHRGRPEVSFEVGDQGGVVENVFVVGVVHVVVPD